MRRAQLGELARLAPPSLPSGIIQEVVHDHCIVLAALRARLLGEYLRRLALEPLGSPPKGEEPRWSRCGRVLTDSLVRPARSVDALLQLPIGKEAIVIEALNAAITSEHLSL